MPQPLPLKVGAQYSTFLGVIHPAKQVAEAFPNRTHHQRIWGLLALRLETLKVNRKEQVCVILRHDVFPNVLLHAVRRWVQVDVAGSTPITGVESATSDNDGDEEDEPQEIPQDLLTGRTGPAEDIAEFRNAGFDVDDNNKPAPENVPGDSRVVDTTYTWDVMALMHGNRVGEFL